MKVVDIMEVDLLLSLKKIMDGLVVILKLLLLQMNMELKQLSVRMVGSMIPRQVSLGAGPQCFMATRY